MLLQQFLKIYFTETTQIKGEELRNTFLNLHDCHATFLVSDSWHSRLSCPAQLPWQSSGYARDVGWHNCLHRLWAVWHGYGSHRYSQQHLEILPDPETSLPTWCSLMASEWTLLGFQIRGLLFCECIDELCLFRRDDSPELHGKSYWYPWNGGKAGFADERIDHGCDGYRVQGHHGIVLPDSQQLSEIQKNVKKINLVMLM